MPVLTDPELLACIRAVLSNWHVTDYIVAKEEALGWAGKNLPGFTLKTMAQLMHDHVQGGGTIDQVRETRPEWDDWPYHYDFRLAWAGRMLYIETLLDDDDPSDPYLRIVRIKDA
ncbi:MAG TPA: hypothetical protein VE988_05015 [Gemmataceae bacterium]|nr:hypothetical protein [Gemmataceae bacterium]